MSLENFMTTAEVARELGVSRQRVLRLVALGRIPHVRRGNTWFYLRSEIRKQFAGKIAAKIERERAERDQGGLEI